MLHYLGLELRCARTGILTKFITAPLIAMFSPWESGTNFYFVDTGVLVLHKLPAGFVSQMQTLGGHINMPKSLVCLYCTNVVQTCHQYLNLSSLPLQSL